MPAPAPLVSFILVCRNPGARLAAALASLRAAAGATAEVLVIDGASTDGTAAWLESRRGEFAVLVSEPDRGVYEAMNKGVARAAGEWVLFLGADDRLVDDALARIAPVLIATTAGVVVGEATYDDGRAYPPAPPAAAVRRNFVHHQAAFYRRAILTPAGGFDAGLRVMGDYDLNLRLLRSGTAFVSVPVWIAECGGGGLSDAGAWTGYREEITVRHRHFPAWRCWLWDVGSAVRWLRKQFVRTFSTHG